MKPIHILLLSLIVFTILSSCTKLIREDYSTIEADQFFKTEADISATVTDYYRDAVMLMHRMDYEATPAMSEAQTDIMEFSWSSGAGYIANHFYLTETNYSLLLASYPIIVQHISRGTNLLYRLESGSIEMDDSKRRRYIAEVRALRTHCALWGYLMYGGVELFLDPVILANVDKPEYRPRATKQEMADFIVSEIDAIKDDLVPRYSKNHKDYGRISRGAALTIKLKVLMQEERFVEAEATAREIMTIGYDLVPTYKDIFTIENEGHIETIWSIPAKTNIWPGNAHLSVMLPYDYPTATSIDKWGSWRIRWSFYDTFDPLDERRKKLIAEYTNTSGNLVKRGNGELQKGCISLKYDIDANMTGRESGIDWIIYRYADVLLLLAEAINENNNGPNAEAIGLINRIRGRAFPNMPGKLLELSDYAGQKSKFNASILKERGHELYMEWTRRQDLVRHKKFLENASTVVPRGPISNRIILWPIPPNIVAQSKGVVKQNPDY